MLEGLFYSLKGAQVVICVHFIKMETLRQFGTWSGSERVFKIVNVISYLVMGCEEQ